MNLGLADKVALVTGSYRGTGAAIAASLASEGVLVLVHGFEPGQPDEVAASIVASGGRAVPVVGDLLSDEGVDDLFRNIDAALDAQPEQFSGLDIAVCNYGAADRGSWTDAGSGGWIEAYERNVLSATRVITRAAPVLMGRGWGRIVLLGTVGSIRPGERNPQYYTAKAALPGMTVSLAKEVAGSGVTVNLVSPGIIATAEVTERLAGRSVGEVFGIPTLTGSPAETTEVADLVTYVCSKQAASITGANFRIDSGSAQAVTP